MTIVRMLALRHLGLVCLRQGRAQRFCLYNDFKMCRFAILP